MEALSERQMTAIRLIAAGNSEGEVARQLYITPRLVRRWRQRNPRFQVRLAWALSDRLSYGIWAGFATAAQQMREGAGTATALNDSSQSRPVALMEASDMEETHADI